MSANAPQFASFAKQQMDRRDKAARERAIAQRRRQRELADLQLESALAEQRRDEAGERRRSRARAAAAARGQRAATGSAAAVQAGGDAAQARAATRSALLRRNRRLDLKGEAFDARLANPDRPLSGLFARLLPGRQRSGRLTP